MKVIPAPAVRASALALVSLFHAAASRQAGVRLARGLAASCAISTLGTIAWLAHRFGPDAATLRLTSWGAFGLSCLAGGVEGLALSNRGRTLPAYAGLAELARMRGVSDGVVQAAEVAACLRGMAEVVALPLFLIAIIAGGILAGQSIESSARVMIGTALFGLIVTVVLGLLAGGCRLWAGTSGRLWFFALLVVPWAAGTLVSSELSHVRWLSVPGLLGRAWRTLTWS